MKKTAFLFLCALLLCASFFGCSRSTPTIEGSRWELGAVIQTNDSGRETVLFVSEDYEEAYGTVEGASRLEATLKAKGGSFTLSDETNDTSYTGSYFDFDPMSADAADYRIVIGNTKGRALTLRYVDENGDKVVSLSLTVGKYRLLFFS